MISAFCAEQGIELRTNVSLSKHTTFRIGGPADYAAVPSTVEQMGALVSYLNKNNVRYFILGRGSDVLADDKGYRGVILLTEGMKDLRCDGERIYAGAGCSMAAVSNLALSNELAGLEFLHGIPGSIGGGVYMNAGAYGSEICRYLESVQWVDEEGNLRESKGEDLDFSYRHSYFCNHFGVICSAVFRCPEGNGAEIREKMRDLDARRREKQPLEFPSAGSAFKRPEGYFAGKLIEDSGLKGYSVGDAWVSEKHAGFIVNKGNATSAQIHQLIGHVTDRVYEKFGVRLEPEIIFLEE